MGWLLRHDAVHMVRGWQVEPVPPRHQGGHVRALQHQRVRGGRLGGRGGGAHRPGPHCAAGGKGRGAWQGVRRGCRGGHRRAGQRGPGPQWPERLCQPLRSRAADHWPCHCALWLLGHGAGRSTGDARVCRQDLQLHGGGSWHLRPRLAGCGPRICAARFVHHHDVHVHNHVHVDLHHGDAHHHGDEHRHGHFHIHSSDIAGHDEHHEGAPERH
mmetsp:Transcript_105065/g.255048  ORF Transcript_105065/g.255048 Transcript_105065/m.255048 type:complete len:214 (+) Transcript_105065:271-912(+)